MEKTKKTLDEWRNEYIGTVFGASAFTFLVLILTADATDDLKEQHPKVFCHNVKRIVNNLMGRGDYEQGTLARLRLYTQDLMKDKRIGMAWCDDFGNSVYSQLEADLQRMQVAVANVLGKYPKVFDRNIAAKIIIAQSLASEQAKYIERRAEIFRGFSLQTEYAGHKENVSTVLGRLSCRSTERLLRSLAFELLDKVLPDDVDITHDFSVQIGAKAIFNRLGNTETWRKARDEADRLNKEEL